MEGVLKLITEMCKHHSIAYVCYTVNKQGEAYIINTDETHKLLHKAAIFVQYGTQTINALNNIPFPPMEPIPKNYDQEFALFMKESAEIVKRYEAENNCTHSLQLWREIEEKYPSDQISNRTQYIQALLDIYELTENKGIHVTLPSSKEELKLYSKEYQTCAIEIQKMFPTINEVHDYFFVMEYYDHETQMKKIEFTYQNGSHSDEISALVGFFDQ